MYNWQCFQILQSHSLKMALWKKPKHVAVIFYLSFKYILYNKGCVRLNNYMHCLSAGNTTMMPYLKIKVLCDVLKVYNLVGKDMHVSSSAKCIVTVGLEIYLSHEGDRLGDVDWLNNHAQLHGLFFACEWNLFLGVEGELAVISP